MNDPNRHAFRDSALMVLIMAISIAGGLAGWRIAHWIGDRPQTASTDISSQSRTAPPPRR